MIAKKDTYLDANGKVTYDTQKAARWLARKGTEVQQHVVKQYGLDVAEPVAESKTSESPKPFSMSESVSAPKSKSKGKDDA